MGRDVEKNLRQNRERRAWYKEHGICPDCGRREAIPGRVMCLPCTIRDRERKQKNKDRYNAVKREHRAARVAAGLCIGCGREVTGFQYCERCRALRRDNVRICRIKKRLEAEVNDARQKSRAYKPGDAPNRTAAT